MIATEPATETAVLTLPGIVCTKTSAAVFPNTPLAKVIDAFVKISGMNDATAWWIGDIGIELQDRKRVELRAEASRLRAEAKACSNDQDGRAARDRQTAKAEHLEAKGVIEYTAELCHAHNISEGHVKNCVMWARFYEPSHRYDGLSPKHHQVAMAAAGGAKGDVSKAQRLLVEAKEAGWKASDLRKHVNVTQATARAPATAPEVNRWDAGDHFDKWAALHEKDVITPDVAAHLMTRWQAAIGFIERVKAAAEKVTAP